MRRFAPVLAILLAATGARSEDITLCIQGLDAQRAGNYDVAIADYDRCLRGSNLSIGHQAIAYYNRGNAYGDIGEYNRAIADYDTALALQPGYVYALNNRGNAYVQKGEYERAMADFDAAIRLKPDFAEAFNNRCYDQAILGRLSQALADCDRSLAMRANDAKTLDSRGYARLRAGDYAGAVADYSAAIKIYTAKGSDAAVSYFGRGLAYQLLGKRDLAEQHFRQALAIDPAIEAKMAKIGLSR